MKFCPYCGATLLGGAVSFCAECGKTLPSPQKSPGPVRGLLPHQAPKQKQPPARRLSQPCSRNPKKPFPGQNGRRPSSPHSGKRPEPPRRPRPDPRDEGYDGYYDDVKPIDHGHARDQSDPELMKRLIIIAAGALLIVIFAVVVMYVL